MCVLFSALFQLEPSSIAFRTFSAKIKIGLRFDDDHDHICYRFAQVRIFAGKSNVFRSLQPVPVVAIISQNCGLFSWSKYIKLFGPHTILIYFAIKLDNVLCYVYNRISVIYLYHGLTHRPHGLQSNDPVHFV
jgi:hypothetical protein